MREVLRWEAAAFVSRWAWQHAELGRGGCASRQAFLSPLCPAAIPNTSSSSAFSGRVSRGSNIYTATCCLFSPVTVGLASSSLQLQLQDGKTGRRATDPNEGREAEPACRCRGGGGSPGGDTGRSPGTGRGSRGGLRALRGSIEHGVVFSRLAYTWGRVASPLTPAMLSHVRPVSRRSDALRRRPSRRAPRGAVPAHSRAGPRSAFPPPRLTANRGSACKYHRAAGRWLAAPRAPSAERGCGGRHGGAARPAAALGRLQVPLRAMAGLQRPPPAQVRWGEVRWGEAGARGARRGRGGAARGRRSVYKSRQPFRCCGLVVVYLMWEQTRPRKIFAFFVFTQDASVRSWKLPGQNHLRWRCLRNAAESIYGAAGKRLQPAGAGPGAAPRRSAAVRAAAGCRAGAGWEPAGPPQPAGAAQPGGGPVSHAGLQPRPRAEFPAFCWDRSVC